MITYAPATTKLCERLSGNISIVGCSVSVYAIKIRIRSRKLTPHYRVEELATIHPTNLAQPCGVLSNIIHLILRGYGIKTVLNIFINKP